MMNFNYTKLWIDFLKLFLITALVVIAVRPVSGQTVPAITINEIRIDQPDADNDEYFELTGGPNAALNGLTYIVIGDGTGGSGVIEAVVDLTGQTILSTGFFVAAESTFTLGAANLITTLNFENGDNVTHLLVEGFTGSNGDDLDTNDDGVLDVIPWTSVVDSVALIQIVGSGDLVYSATTVGPDGGFVPGHVFRNPDGTGAFQIGGFTLGTNDTPGESNVGDIVVPLDLAIYEIQGGGHISPFEGESVRTVGIVTAVDSNGFYLQDRLGDGSDNTSDGIFVFTGSAPGVNVGDELQVQGTVSEFIPGGASTNNLSITQIVSPAVEIISSGNVPPAPIALGRSGRILPNRVIDNDNFALFDPNQDGIDFYESLEGMLVTAVDAQAVSATNGFGEIFAVVDRGRGATGLSVRRTINISPNDFNPERVQIQFDGGILPGFSASVNVRDRLGDVTGVVNYSFGNFEVLVTEEFTPTSTGLRPETTNIEPTRNRLTIAGYNVLNLDPKVEDPALTDGGLDDVDDDAGDGRFEAIAGQIVNNLNLPDIIALQEIQDNDGAEISSVTSANETLQMLVDEIAGISGIAYEFIDNPFIGNGTGGGQPGGNIRTVFLYNPSRVALVAGSVQTVADPVNQQTDEDNPFFDSRLPLAVTFAFRGREITVVNNHFTSKGGSSPLFGQIQPSVSLQELPDVNGGLDDRRAQAAAVKDFVYTILSGNPDANIAVLGDLNEFEFISPLEILEKSLINLTETLPANERYSFIFDGNSQSLDHILVSKSLIKTAVFDIVHVNTEFARTPQTASDHDPSVARFRLR